MLTGNELAQRIIAAMDWREPRVPSVLVAKKCGVTPQAVNKWRRDGTVDLKKHLAPLASVTQVPPMFFLETERGSMPETKSAWQRLLDYAATVTPIALITFAALPLIRWVDCVLCQIGNPQIRLAFRPA